MILVDGLLLGPWRCGALLGEGGMARVYDAVHEGTGEVAAVKTVAAGSPTERRALRRESEALRSLRHPSVPRWLAADLDAAAPWLAMERVNGAPLTGVLPRTQPTTARLTWTAELPPPEAAARGPMAPVPVVSFDDATLARLAWLAQVAHALAHLHGAGWVHCDLKPGNVLVTEPGRAVLVDFGLVTWRGPRADPASIAEIARTAGTAAYMSPERARGAHFDARADLYALGCMIYEAVTGSVPFPQPSAGMALLAHLHGEVPRLEERVPEVPTALARLVRDLLAKVPEERPGHAQQVLTVFAGLGVAVPSQPLPAHGPLYAPALVGRDGPLRQLVDHGGRGLSGPGTAQWLVGESGSGKSRLARALVEELAPVRQPRVVVGGATSVPGPGGPRPSGVPLEVFLEPLRRAMDWAHSTGVAPSPDAVALVRPFAPFVADGGGLAAPPDLDQVDAGRDRLHSAVLELLAPLVHDQPTLWVLDDLQWMDELSRGVLDEMLRRLPDEPWSVLGLARSEGQVVLPTEGRAQPLPPLAPEAVDALVAGHLGAEAPEALRAWVRAHAGGNAFFVGECLRTAVAESFLTLDAGGRWRFAAGRGADLQRRPLPATLGELVGFRLRGLPARVRQVAEGAAVLGRIASVPVLRRVLDMDEGPLRAAIGDLARRAVLRPADDGASVAFVHDRLAEHVYAAVDAPRRQRLHGRAADALEAAGGGDATRVPWHRERAGQRQRARAGWLAVARAARARFAFDEAEAAYRAAIALSDGPAAAAPLRRALAREVLLVRGRVRAAEAELEQVLAERGPDRGEDAELWLERARVALSGEGWAAGTAALARAEAAAREAGRLDLVAAVWSERGAARAREGKPAEAEALHRKALALLGPEADPTARADVMHRVGLALHHQGKQEAAMELFAASLRLHRERGDLVRQAKALVTLGNTAVFLGRPDEGMAHYREALALHRRLGNRRGEGYVLGNIASIHTREGRRELAARTRAEALAIHRATGNRRLEGILLRAVGLQTVEDGRLEDGLQVLADSRARLAEARDRMWLAHVDAALGRTHRYLGNFATAEALVTAAEQAYRAIGATDILCDAWLQRVHLEVARGGDPGPWIRRIERAAEGAPANGLRDRALSRARALARAVEQGEALLGGDRVADLPDALRSRLAAHRGAEHGLE